VFFFFLFFFFFFPIFFTPHEMPPQTRSATPPAAPVVAGDDAAHSHDGIDLKKVRSSIPAHCFEISTATAVRFYLQDCALIAGLYFLRLRLAPGVFDGSAVPGGPVVQAAVSFATRFAWWNAVGFMFWAWFVIGHDCGHGTFSKSRWVNHIFGHLAHVPILVPYHGWRQTHRIHHMYHNDLGRDKTWAPIRESHLDVWNATTWPGALYRFVRYTPLMLFMFPYYLVAPGGDLTYGSHFNPLNETIYPTPGDKVHGAIGGALIGAFLAVINYFVLTSDNIPGALMAAWDLYFIPYWIFTAWLSLVTYLHHTGPESLFYRNSAWSFTRGAETTIDRNYGAVLNYLHHNIETHFVHHLFFTKIPHYNLVEATRAALPALGDTYKYDARNPLWTFVTEIAGCRAVPDTGDVVGFTNGNKGKKKSM
jgi:omega-3 fatty acid desaturase (delta-15 desaturase)